MVIESWLADVSPSEQRGRVLSIYLFVSLVGMAAGQMLMLLGPADDLRLFVIAAILISIAIVPIGLTRISSPHPIPAVKFSPLTLIRAARVAVVGALLSGMVVGTFWALGPVVARAYELDASRVGILMSLGVLGGALAQIPVGKFSDSTDRRIVIGAVCLVATGVSVLGFYFARDSFAALYGSFFLLGAAAMPIYALCIAHASDKSTVTLVEVASGILLAHSAGSIIGPIMVAPLIGIFGPAMFFAFSAVCFAVAAAWTFYRCFVVERSGQHDPHTAMLPKTTQAIAGLAPTTDIGS
jgi:MFS family permease